MKYKYSTEAHADPMIVCSKQGGRADEGVEGWHTGGLHLYFSFICICMCICICIQQIHTHRQIVRREEEGVEGFTKVGCAEHEEETLQIQREGEYKYKYKYKGEISLCFCVFVCFVRMSVLL